MRVFLKSYMWILHEWRLLPQNVYFLQRKVRSRKKIQEKKINLNLFNPIKWVSLNRQIRHAMKYLIATLWYFLPPNINYWPLNDLYAKCPIIKSCIFMYYWVKAAKYWRKIISIIEFDFINTLVSKGT